jgi:hypothetical protein
MLPLLWWSGHVSSATTGQLMLEVFHNHYGVHALPRTQNKHYTQHEKALHKLSDSCMYLQDTVAKPIWQ